MCENGYLSFRRRKTAACSILHSASLCKPLTNSYSAWVPRKASSLARVIIFLQSYCEIPFLFLFLYTPWHTSLKDGHHPLEVNGRGQNSFKLLFFLYSAWVPRKASSLARVIIFLQSYCENSASQSAAIRSILNPFSSRDDNNHNLILSPPILVGCFSRPVCDRIVMKTI